MVVLENLSVLFGHSFFYLTLVSLYISQSLMDVLHALGFSEPDITVAPPPTPVSQLPSASNSVFPFHLSTGKTSKTVEGW